MNLPRHFPARFKLVGGLTLILGLLLVALSSVYTSATAIREAHSVTLQKDLKAMAYWQLCADLDHQRYQIFEMILAPRPAQQRALEQQVNIRAKEIDAALARIAATNQPASRMSLQLEELKQLRRISRHTRDTQIIPLLHQGHVLQAQQLQLGIQHVRFERIEFLAQSMAKESEVRARQQALLTQQVEAQSVQRIVTVSILTLLVGVAVLLWWIETVVRAAVRGLGNSTMTSPVQQ